MITSSVNFNLYKSFVAVYEQKNISRAAAQLEITQPTVTYNIKELERQLGTKLFHTHPRGVEPTKDAHELYKYVSEGMTSIANGESAIREFNEGSFGTIRLCTPAGILSDMFAKCMATFNAKYPNIKFELTDVKAGGSTNKLAQHAVDLVISSYTVINPPLAAVDLREYPRVVISNPEFAKANDLTDKVTSKDLDRVPFVMLAFETDLVASKVKASPLITTACESDVVELAAASVGVGICTEEDIRGKENIGILDSSAMTLPNKVLRCIYNRDSVTKPTKAFISVVCEVFGVYSPFKSVE